MSLNREETMVFRALKRTAVILMVARYLDKPVGESEIAAILDISPKTARSHLRSLAALGFLTRLQYHQGYQLTHAGRQMALPLEPVESQPEPALLPACDPGGLSSDPPPEDQAPAERLFDAGVEGGSTRMGPGRSSEADRLPPIEPLETGCRLPPNPVTFPGSPIITIKDKESLNESIKNSSSNNHPVKIPNPEDLPLEKQPIHQMVVGFLAEHGIYINSRTRQLLGKISCDDILAVAHELGLQNKTGETGLFVVCLEQRVAQGLANWQEVYGPPPLQAETPEPSWQPEEIEPSPPRAVRGHGPRLDFAGPPEIEQAWYAAVDLAGGEIPRAGFDSWLAPTYPLAWEADTQALRVGVANPYGRDWLEERAKTLLTKHLASILDSSAVSVTFEVYG